ncbi:WSC domain-containing protein 1-like [Penaeus monodon]|uniref:WSC domain-containing protein 1-like n=1 Tax=Penaeus monodon TaxID=6687 RepID=UPI0018A6DE79|nr:WSC domain-containing protein 1-like [Penaeus monodon]
MKLCNVSLRCFLALILLGILFIIGYSLRGAYPGHFISASLPLRYGGLRGTIQGTFMGLLYGEEEENEWKAMPDERNGQLPQERWPELNLSMPTASLWPSDPACSMYNVSFARNHPETFLVSFPRSGNSWMRYLTEGASGVATAAVYSSEKLYHFEMQSDLKKLRGKIILTKTHISSRLAVPDQAPVILLLRNPAKSIVSYYNYVSSPGGKRWIYNVSYKSYFKQSFVRFANRQLPAWKKLARNRLLYSRRILVIPYEELREDPIAQVRRALAFLGVPADEARLACLQNHLKGPAMGLQRQVDPYSPEQKMAIKKAIANVSDLLQKRNFPPLPAYN